MTVLFVFVALLIANFLFTRWDDKRVEESRRLQDFYRIEYKKSYDATVDTNWMGKNWAAFPTGRRNARRLDMCAPACMGRGFGMPQRGLSIFLILLYDEKRS